MRSNVISSQGVHDRFGGVVPEIASRHHLELVNLVVEQALARGGESTLEDIELVAATQGPGLVGALLVGLSTAKALAAARELPFAAVDHLQGHVAANFLGDPRWPGERRHAFEPPFVCLIASGGHTLLTHVTRARRLRGARPHARRRRRGGVRQGRADARPGLPGRRRARAAGRGRRSARVRASRLAAPSARAGGKGTGRQAFEQGLDFSFAGLKTALLYRLRDLSAAEIDARAPPTSRPPTRRRSSTA